MFEEKVRLYMRSQNMYGRNSNIFSGISGGKDSLALAEVLNYIREKDGVSVTLLHLNFGQKGSNILEKYVERFADERSLPIHIWRLEDDWGLTFDELSRRTKKNPCSLCSQLLRYYLLYIPWKKGADVVATGHNLDDIASFVLYNVMTGSQRYSDGLRPVVKTVVGVLKVKPFFFMKEEKIAEYVKQKNITPVPTGCPSEDEAPTVMLRRVLKEIERKTPGARKNIVKFFLNNKVVESKPPNRCKMCGMPSSGDVCSVCRLRMKVERR